MAGETHTGYAAKAYYNTGTYAAPTWVEIPMAQDATVNIEGSELEASTRASGGFKLSEVGLTAVSVDLKLLYLPGTTAFDYLRAAALAKTSVEVAFLDGDEGTAGSEGIRFCGKLFSFPREEPLDGLLTVSTTIKPVINTNGTGSVQQNPEWMTTT